MSDTLEMWTDFVRGERIAPKRPRGPITCDVCEFRASNPKHDGAVGERDRPVRLCDGCMDAIDRGAA